jgi:hypothetical protein
MTSDEPPASRESSAGSSAEPSPPPGEGVRRPPPPIDLSATEIEAAAAPAAEEADAPEPQPVTGSDHARQPEDVSGKQATDDPPPRRRGGWWPALAAGAVAGAVAGACIPLLLQATGVFPAGEPGARGLDARLSRVEAALREAPSPSASAGVDKRALDDLSGRLAKLEAAVTASRPALDTESANRVTAVEGDLKALTETVGILARRSDELTTNVREARQRADSTAATVAELKAVPRAQAASIDKLEGQIQALTSRMAAAETELAKRAGAQSSDRSGRFAVAAAALAAAVERGQPFAAELAAVSSFAPDPKLLAPFAPFAAAGLPTTAALGKELEALIPSLYAAVAQTSERGSFLEKLQANAGKLVRIHPTQEAPGSDPATVVERIEIKAGKSDITGALAELATLPPAARAPAAGWMEKAQARSAAVEASRRLAADALAGLSK